MASVWPPSHILQPCHLQKKRPCHFVCVLQGLLPAGELANLPVPLLAQHAAKLGGQSAVRQCEQQRQQLQATHLACQ